MNNELQNYRPIPFFFLNTTDPEDLSLRSAETLMHRMKESLSLDGPVIIEKNFQRRRLAKTNEQKKSHSDSFEHKQQEIPSKNKNGNSRQQKGNHSDFFLQQNKEKGTAL